MRNAPDVVLFGPSKVDKTPQQTADEIIDLLGGLLFASKLFVDGTNV